MKVRANIIRSLLVYSVGFRAPTDCRWCNEFDCLLCITNVLNLFRKKSLQIYRALLIISYDGPRDVYCVVVLKRMNH